ncbi:hypothetical protein M1601_01660 [Mycoplasma capricolum subsp. capripneumoniae M1601]|nr:hypothetical protein M1601_01660 [Mycoplasma capricolum subsp. capripneumoniae M1601]
MLTLLSFGSNLSIIELLELFLANCEMNVLSSELSGEPAAFKVLSSFCWLIALLTSDFKILPFCPDPVIVDKSTLFALANSSVGL